MEHGNTTSGQNAEILKLNKVLHIYIYIYIYIYITVLRTDDNIFNNLQVHSTCFGCQPHPLSAVHKTVTSASDSGRIFCAATSLQRGQVAQKI